MVMMMVMIIVSVRMFMRMFMSQKLVIDLPFSDEWVNFTYYHAKYIRLFRQVFCTSSISNAVNDHRWEAFGELIYNPGNNACTCRCGHLHAIVCRSDRDASHHFKCRWSGNWIDTMIDMDGSRP
ncbi:hypothetical protein D3C84_902460 [compost metagenome]